jgi:hypothetical protein
VTSQWLKWTMQAKWRDQTSCPGRRREHNPVGIDGAIIGLNANDAIGHSKPGDTSTQLKFGATGARTTNETSDQRVGVDETISGDSPGSLHRGTRQGRHLGGIGIIHVHSPSA